MSNPGASAIECARSDISRLRRGLDALAAELTAWRAAIPRAEQMLLQFSELADYLDRLGARLDEQEKERAQLQGFFQVSRALNSTLELEQVLNRAMDVIIEVTRAERGFLMLANPLTGELTFEVARNMDRVTITSPAFEVSRSIIRRVAERGAPILTTDALRDPRFSDQDSVVSLSLRSILCNPLKAKDRIIGVVYVDNRLHVGQFSAVDADALRAFADQAAIAIDNARLFQSVRQKMDEISALKTFQDNIFASIASGVIATDLSDRITAFNRAAETVFAIPAQSAVGKLYDAVLAPLASTALPKLVQEVKRAGARYVAAETEATLPDRGNVNLSFSVSSLKDASGAPQGITIVVDDLTEKRRLEATREMFRRYVAPAVVDRLPPNPAELKLGGNRREITILFADIRGFTHLSEEMAPEELVDVLNRYLAAGADAVLQQEGTLDKFLGDAVMAIFNAPLPQPDHVLRAARAALAMRAAVAELHRRLPAPLHLNYGIGIHTGEAVVGNVGTTQQMNYTAIGDAVNLAKRLQENAAGGQIILSSSAYASILRWAQARRLPSLKVKGRKAVTEVWELVSLNV